MRIIATIILFLIGLICSTEASAQVPGYQGKRFILKIDPLSPLYQKGIIASIDYVIARRLAFSASYQYSNRDYTQRISAYKRTWGTFPKNKGNIKDHQFGVEIQFYTNRSIPAPKGSYIYINYFQGLAKATGDVYKQSGSELLTPYTIENLRSQISAIGLGNKSIAWNIVVLEFDFGLALGNLVIPEGVNDSTVMSFQSFTDRYGPNLYSFGKLTGNGGMGLTGHLKIGFLLF
ncbi:MAG: hypothetical protein ACPG19_07975 [Saprospiraceae bacterium]